MLNVKFQDYIIVTQTQANTLLLKPTQKSSCGTSLFVRFETKTQTKKIILEQCSNFLRRQVDFLEKLTSTFNFIFNFNFN
jgi:hypothetical protein